MASELMDETIIERVRRLNLPPLVDRSQYVVISVRGDGVRAPASFNIKVYKSKKGYRLASNDEYTLKRLLSGKVRKNEFNRIIDIDDSGWGFPLLGVLVGMYDSETRTFKYGEIDVSFFQGEKYSNKEYLEEYARKGVALVEGYKVDKECTLIRICTGYVNTRLKDRLRELGYEVDVAEIQEPLQSALEKRHMEYVKEKISYDVYYDPKDVDPQSLGRRFREVMRFIKEKKMTHLAKTGWKNYSNL